MSNLWNKVKLYMEQSAKAAKDSAESVVKSVSEKAPKIASSIAEKSKEFAETITDKTQEMVTQGQLKHKQHGLSRDISDQFTDIGRRTYDLIKKRNKEIVKDLEVSEMIESVKKMEVEMIEIEKKLEQLHSKETLEDESVKQTESKTSETQTNDKTNV